ncbi:MAG: hypothetical protein QNJ11_13815 [Woeseiaceae bacterium]|nr:hypothetical protein [Woeseiaceae bacterium]
MKDKVKKRIDAFTLALGGVAAKSAYANMPIVADDRINAAWDEKLRKGPAECRQDPAPEGACAGWAT